jgi:hypothetical protein
LVHANSQAKKKSLIEKIVEKSRICSNIETKINEYNNSSELNNIDKTLKENEELKIYFADLQ